MFVSAPDPETVGAYIQSIRTAAAGWGRNPQDIIFSTYIKAITGGTEAEARRKYDDFFEQVSYEGALALLSGWLFRSFIQQ